MANNGSEQFEPIEGGEQLICCEEDKQLSPMWILVTAALMLFAVVVTVPALQRESWTDSYTMATLDDSGTLTIKGINGGGVIDGVWTRMPTDAISKVKKLYISNGIKGISSCEFSGFYNLTEVVIDSEDFVCVEYLAFYGCHYLEKVTIKRCCSVIEWSAFKGCYALREVSVPDNCIIASDAFDDCYQLNDVNKTEDGIKKDTTKEPVNEPC